MTLVTDMDLAVARGAGAARAADGETAVVHGRTAPK
jgi:hypothetical protein